jgi:hypothetical protein
MKYTWDHVKDAINTILRKYNNFEDENYDVVEKVYIDHLPRALEVAELLCYRNQENSYEFRVILFAVNEITTSCYIGAKGQQEEFETFIESHEFDSDKIDRLEKLIIAYEILNVKVKM